MRQKVLLAAIIAVITIVDQATKIVAAHSLPWPRRYLGGLLTLIHAENSGAFLSLGASLPERTRALIFSGLVTLGLGAALWALAAGKIRAGAEQVAVAMIIGGGIGNLIDRVARGRVTDFVYLELGPLHTGIFNLADVAITAGVIWLAVDMVTRRKPAG